MADNSGLIVAALERTDPELARRVDASNSWQAALITRGARVAKYRRYERGDHDADLTAQMEKMLRLDSGDNAELNEFNDNYCRIIVDKMAGRLHVSSVGDDSDAVQEWIAKLMDVNDWEALEGEIFRGAIRDADSYLMVDSRTGRWTAEPAYDGFSGMVAIFGSDRKPVWACKLWSEADNQDLSNEQEDSENIAVMRVIVYQPDTVSYWRGRRGTEELTPTHQDGTLASEQVKEKWPLGKIPIIHIVNQKDNYNELGTSELRPAIPLQNALNRTLHSMIMASEFSAFPVRWSIGMSMDVDGITPGAVVGLVLKAADGTVETNLSEEQIKFLAAVKVGAFEPADITQYTQQISKLVREISQATQTPIYGVTTQGAVSGDALRQLEIGLIGKVERFQRENTAALRELFELTAEMHRTFEGLGPAPEFDALTVVWKSPEILDVSARVASLVTMRKDAPNLWTDDWYRDQIGALLGLDKSKVQEEGNRVEEQQARQMEFMVGSAGNLPPGSGRPTVRPEAEPAETTTPAQARRNLTG